MIHKNSLRALIAVATLAPLAAIAHTHAVHRAQGEPDLRSTSVLVMDQARSAVIYSRQAEVARPIASITKLMTSLVVLDAGQPLDETLEVSPEDRIVGKGAYSRLAIGTQLTRGELMRLALMSSENRAAHTLATHYPGGLAACIAAMNAKAKAIGMEHAHFVDPAGLSSQNVASATDLSKLVATASKNPTIREYSTGPNYSVKIGHRLVEFRNTNSLVKNPAWDIVVQKTGYIQEAGRCLVMQTIIQGRSVVIVLLNSFGKYTRVADAQRIRKWMQLHLAELGGGQVLSG